MSKPLTANLRVAHRTGCPSGSRTSLGSLEGCTCRPGPTYYTFHRDRTGRTAKGPRVRDRQVAERALRKLLVDLDDDRVEVGPRRRERRTFDSWAEEHLENLERDRGLKGSTIRGYRSTLVQASPIFGSLTSTRSGSPRTPPLRPRGPQVRCLRRDRQEAPQAAERDLQRRRRRGAHPPQPDRPEVRQGSPPQGPARVEPYTNAEPRSSGRRWRPSVAARRSTCTSRRRPSRPALASAGSRPELGRPRPHRQAAHDPPALGPQSTAPRSRRTTKPAPSS